MLTAERVHMRSDLHHLLHKFNFRKAEEKTVKSPFCLYISAPRSAPSPGNFLAQSVKVWFPLRHTDLLCRFRLIASVTIGAILELVTPSAPPPPSPLLPPSPLPSPPLTGAVVDGRVASLRLGVPSGPTGSHHQAGQFQADTCI